MTTTRIYTPILIIGSGIAGCTTALCLADAGFEVTIINSGKTLHGGNTDLAQGGIIYKSDVANDAKMLEKDILTAGHKYNYTKSVQHLCKHGADIVDKILFDRCKIDFDNNEDGSFNLTREGGHSNHRILHKADFTGKAIMEGLTKAVSCHDNIKILTNNSAIDLLTSQHHAKQSEFRYSVQNRCVGAYIFDEKDEEAFAILADYTILATGGVGQVYLHTTNSTSAVGSALSMAHRAGVTLSNLEFMQFHPTALYQKFSSQRSLITEAMRGEGAQILDAKFKPLMDRYDARGDLSPRDIVTFAMLQEMQITDTPCLFLDTSKIKKDIKERFPTVYESCLNIGIDMLKEPIPIVPAAHYFCGGILTDLRGRTSLKGLYSVGECSCTGLHGANRLASTSLLEGLVWAYYAAQDIARNYGGKNSLSQKIINAVPDWEHVGTDKNDDPALVTQDWTSIRNTMWNYVGISRSSAKLNRAFEDLRDLSRHIHIFYKRTKLSKRLVDLFHGSHTAYIITQAALRNKNSIGCHKRL